MKVSSAKRLILDLTQHGRSLIKIGNINGPSTYPWGTPEVTGTKCECSPSRTTLCLFFSRKLFNHRNVVSSMPHLNNLYSKLLCGTLSNALLKSITMTSVCPPPCISFSRKNPLGFGAVGCLDQEPCRDLPWFNLRMLQMNPPLVSKCVFYEVIWICGLVSSFESWKCTGSYSVESF